MARQLEPLLARFGALAAAAFSGHKADKAAVVMLNAEIEEARQAQAALPTLQTQAESAHLQKDAAYGALRVLRRNAGRTCGRGRLTSSRA